MTITGNIIRSWWGSPDLSGKFLDGDVVISHVDVSIMRGLKRMNQRVRSHPNHTRQGFDFYMNLGGFQQ